MARKKRVRVHRGRKVFYQERPRHHRVGLKVARGEVKRAEEILEKEKGKLMHAESQLHKAERHRG
jgi:hypothetical protein